MTDEEVIQRLREEVRTLSMKDLRSTWRQNRSDWVQAMRSIRLREAEWHTSVKWHVLLPEFDTRGKRP